MDAPFPVSERCCDIMKKRPMKKYQKETAAYPIIGTMACESRNRKLSWIQNGCNAFDAKEPKSQPMSFWTEQDVLEYLYQYQISYCPVYGDIEFDSEEVWDWIRY